MKNEKNYDKEVKDWFYNNLGNRAFNITSFLKALKDTNVLFNPTKKEISCYVIFLIIEGDILLIKGVTSGEIDHYFLLYQRNNYVVRLIFPFELDYRLNNYNPEIAKENKINL